MTSYTRQNIANTLKRLLEKKSLDKITVKMICESCEINRQTFYYYYDDIVDLVKTMMRDDLMKVISDNRTMHTWQNGFVETLKYFKQSEPMMLNIYYSAFWPELKRYFEHLSDRVMTKVVDECAADMPVQAADTDKNFIIVFYRILFIGIMEDWLKNGMKETPERVLEQLLHMISGNISKSLGSFAEKSE